MKELSIEEKAKRYDDRLEKARKWYDANTNEGYKGIFEDIFPELKDEDERIREAIIATIHLYYGEPLEDEAKEMIAWLEKQGEQPKQDISDINDYNNIDPHFGKPVDKAEPKFNLKVGQWIVTTGKCVYLITKIDGFNVTLVDTNGDEYVFDTSSLDNAHLWDITKDAKDGDVLVHNGCTFIFMGIENGIVKAICTKLSDTILSFGEVEYENDYCPATKGQRDTLLKAMTDAGYTFDFERKELRKIEHNKSCMALDMVKEAIDTLEVKEVDLEKEIELVKGDYEQVDVAWNNDFDYIAKHFFELGMAVNNKAQKGE